MASYVSYPAMAEAGMADPWTAFCYREKPRAYEADALPGRQPVSSPVATAADAHVPAGRADLLQGRRGDQAAGRADRRRRAAGRAGGLHAAVRRRHREPGRPDRLLVPFVRPGPERLGAGMAAHRGCEHAAGLGGGRGGRHAGVAGRGAGRAADAPARHRALRSLGARVGPAAAPGDQRGGQRGAVRDTGAARGAGPGRGGAQRRGPDLRARSRSTRPPWRRWPRRR